MAGPRGVRHPGGGGRVRAERIPPDAAQGVAESRKEAAGDDMQEEEEPDGEQNVRVREIAEPDRVKTDPRLVLKQDCQIYLL